jgi:OFA family oxalate/formate antiporter-like MFS transporter
MSLQKVSIVFPIMTLTQCVSMPIGPLFYKRVPAQFCILAGAVLCIGGTFLSSYTQSFSAFIFTFPIGFGMGIGMSYLVPLMCAWDYFPERKGLVSGIVIAGFGFAAFFTGILATYLVNDQDVRPDLVVLGGKLFTDERILERVPGMLRAICVLWTCFAFIAIVLIKKRDHYEVRQFTHFDERVFSPQRAHHLSVSFSSSGNSINHGSF